MSGSKEKSRADLEEEVRRLELRVHFYRTQGFLLNASRVLGEALRAIRVVGPQACAVFIAQALAGKTTITSVSGRVESESLKDAIAELVQKESGLASLCVLLLAMAVTGLLYGMRQSRLRQDVVERLGEFKRLYEQRWDPDRSSSKITRRGGTHPEDE
jgi:hypothetical protein